MKESVVTKMFSDDNPEIDVRFFNEPAHNFLLLITYFATPDWVKQALEAKGLDNDESLLKSLTIEAWNMATKYDSDEDERRYAEIHGIYKNLMTKAILKKPFSDDELNAIRLLLSSPPDITIRTEDGKLLINESPQSVIMRRMARGIIDVANGDKDIRICAASDCDVAFVPKRKDHKYHSRSCANRTYKRIERKNYVST